MITKISKVLILLVACCLTHQHLFSQHTSRDNHTGYWEDPQTWDPGWSSPKNLISGYDITINGYITVDEYLSFYGDSARLVVNDTLVIRGSLFLHNSNRLLINDHGILVVRGNVWIDEHSEITANGYFIITGDIYKDNDQHSGLFISNDDPPKLFIGGSVYPEEITDNYEGYPALNCSSPEIIPYPNSKCSSGNMDDLKKDKVYPFFQSTCTLHATTGTISVCPGDSIHLKATGGTYYKWNGPGNFTSDLQNPSLADANLGMSGNYSVYISSHYDCEATDTVQVRVNPLPFVNITSSDDTLCENEPRLLTGSPAGGKFIVERGPGSLTDNILTAKNTGEILIKYTYTDVCKNTDRQTIISSPWPFADAGEKQELEYHFETKLEGTLQPREKGTWSLVSGTGHIEDIHSPETKVTGLSPGENVFLWTVSNGACESGSKVTVTVLDLVVPTVFTPNDDLINDNFYVGDGEEHFDITVFNQWGITEYQSHSYVNHWDGRNNKGNKLPPETYFYVLKFKNGQIKKGSVLIVN